MCDYVFGLGIWFECVFRECVLMLEEVDEVKECDVRIEWVF